MKRCAFSDTNPTDEPITTEPVIRELLQSLLTTRHNTETLSKPIRLVHNLFPLRTWASNGQLLGPVLRLESALLSFFEQFGSVPRSQFNHFLDERCFLGCIGLGRRSGTSRNRYSQLFEEFLLACWRADA